MYSPRISVDLIPRLYYLAKAARKPMTRLVDEMLRDALPRMERSEVQCVHEPKEVFHEENVLPAVRIG